MKQEKIVDRLLACNLEMKVKYKARNRMPG